MAEPSSEIEWEGLRRPLMIGVYALLGFCLIAYARDEQFPFWLGLASLVLAWLGWRTFWIGRRKYLACFMLNGLFTLGFPVFLADIVTDGARRLWGFTYLREDYARLLAVILAAQAALIAAQLAAGHRRPPLKYAAESSQRGVARLVWLSAVLLAVSSYTTYTTGAGVLGNVYHRSTIPYVMGFIARLQQTTIPILNLFILSCLIERRQRRPLWGFLVLMTIEAVFAVYTSLSRLLLLYYLVAPMLFVWASGVARRQRLVPRGLALLLAAAAITAGIAIAQINRDSLYSQLASKGGYSRQFGAASVGHEELDPLNVLRFYRRLTGLQELAWVEAGQYERQAADLWYSVIYGPEPDKTYLHRKVFGRYEVNLNEDTVFGVGLSLVANLALAGNIWVFPGVFFFCLLFCWLESWLARVITGSSIAFMLITMIVFNMWQGYALGTVFLTPQAIMAFVAIALIRMAGRGKSRRDWPAAASAAAPA